MRTTALAALAALVVLVSGCEQAEDKLKDTANDAACSLARETVQGVGDAGSRAVEEIRTDPAQAEQDLSAVRDALQTAERGLSGDVKDQLAKARSAVEDLLDQARKAADGIEVDDQVVDRASGELDQAIDEVTNLC